jgi:thymidylate synthase
MKQYHELLQKVLDDGIESEDRTNTGTLSIFGESFKIDLTKGFPLLTTKYVSFKNILVELVWFLKGSTNAQYMLDNNCHIWDEWIDGQNDLPHTYPEQWRFFHDPFYHKLDGNVAVGVDQIENLINGIKENPNSRRHIVSAWNPLSVNDAALPPCHILFQVYIRNGKLSLLWFQRSQDCLLGLPYNIASYALLTHIIAKLTGYDVHELIYMGGDVHIYKNHIEQVKEQLSRDYNKYALPSLEISDDLVDIDDIDLGYFTLKDYQSYPSIKAEVAV